ncbi:MAG: TonB-dependent receptor [Gemmatimonadota bacterium]|nr:TonB-dependent receptor [Gemmatimonadota bacterium]
MIKSGRLLALVAVAALAIAGSATSRTLGAQSGTTGAIAGVVTDTAGQPLEAAQIQVVNRATGATTGTQSLRGGRYNVPNLDPGGPYSITVRRIGFASQSRDNIRVPLGQAVRQEFALVPQAAQLAVVAVTAVAENSVISPTRTGTNTTISDTLLHRLPTLNRNFTDFVRLTPQISDAGPGLSGGGVNNRFNKIQIDGASSTDVFGLTSTGQPGGQANGKSIPIEAVKEYQVILSSYDVRYGDFAGALVNAVTKNGTNQLSGNAFYQQRNESYARNIPFIRNSTYDQKQYGFSLGGPVVRDKLHFFITSEWQDRNEPATGPYIGSTNPASPVSQAQVDQFNTALAKYAITNPGSALQFQKPNPLKNFFGRLDFQVPSLSSRAVFRYNYVSADAEVFSRSTAATNPLFALSSIDYTQSNRTHSPVFQFFTNFRNGADNEFIAGYSRVRDQRIPGAIAPNVSVQVPSQLPGGGSAVLQAGTEQFSQGNVLDQDLYEITDNFTIPFGNHRVTLGTHNEFFKIRNVFTESSFGVWEFSSIDSLSNGIPIAYRHSASLGGDIIAKFRASSYSAYLEDAWSPSERVSYTFGLRVDMPGLDNAPTHTLAIDTLFNRNTSNVPRRVYQWSPRFGFNWDVTGDQKNQLRGGIGSFTGRPPFVWLGNAYQNNGSGLGFVNCGTSFSGGPSISGPAGQKAPPFSTENVAAPPNYCLNATGGQVGFAQGVLGPVNFIDPNLKFPQYMRTTLGFDHQFTDGTTISFDALYSKAIHELFYVNKNLVGPQGTDSRGRVLYGASIAAPVRVSNRVSEAIDITNQSKNYSYNLTGQIQHRFTGSFEGSLAYTFSKARDVQSLTSSRAVSNFQFGRTISGSHDSQNLGISLFDQPHRIVGTGTYTFPWKKFATDMSVIYIGQSGVPYDFVYGQDINADGLSGNDLIYIPRNSADPNEIQFSGTAASQLQQQNAFESFISGDMCLSQHRGTIIPRNSCRSPWQNRLDLTVRQSLPSVRGNKLSLEIGLFNALNYIGTRFGQEWGLLRFAGSNSNVTLLNRASTSPASATAPQIYTFNTAFTRFTNNNLSSYYQFQAQVKYSFY